MRIDVHSHFFPAPFRQRLRDWGKSVRIEDRNGHPVLYHYRSGTAGVDADNAIPLAPGFYDLDHRLSWMAAHDIDRSVVSISTPSPNEGPFTAAESSELAQAINDGYAALQDDHADDITALGTLPLREPELAVAEVDRIVETLDLAGVALPTTVRGQKLSHPDLVPVFDRLDALDVPALLHPVGNVLSDTLDSGESVVNPLAIFPAETTVQVCRLLYDGFFDRHEFDVVMPHMGGAILHLVGRFERGREGRGGTDRPPLKPIVAYLREFYYDTISFHPPALRAAVETVGAGQLLFGTDFPFGEEAAAQSVADVRASVADAADQRAVFGGTAADLFGL